MRSDGLIFGGSDGRVPDRFDAFDGSIHFAINSVPVAVRAFATAAAASSLDDKLPGVTVGSDVVVDVDGNGGRDETSRPVRAHNMYW
jgi:hypothetical protein